MIIFEEIMRRGLAILVVSLVASVAPGDEPITPEERAKLVRQTNDLNDEAIRHYRAGQPAKAIPLVRQAVAIQERLHGGKDHVDLAACVNNLGAMHQGMGQHAEALDCYSRSVGIYERIYPVTAFKDGHVNLAFSLNNLGTILNEMGDYEGSLKALERALTMRQRLFPIERYPKGHVDVFQSLNNLGHLLRLMGEFTKALPLHEQAVAMAELLYPVDRYKDGHPNLSMSLNNLALIHQHMGEFGKALSCSERAVAMSEKLFPADRFPNGHPDLSRCLSNLGHVLQTLKRYDQALALFERTQAMREKLYPPERYKDGHPTLALGLNNLAFLFQKMKQYRRSLSYYEQALAMTQRLYPESRYRDGHVALSHVLSNTALLYMDMGEFAKALETCEKALKMNQRLYLTDRYKLGHPELARAIGHMGYIHHAAGQFSQAVPYYRRTVRLYAGLVRNHADGDTEARALAMVRSFPESHYGLLDALRHVEETDSAEVYADLWPSKGLILQLTSRRHQAALVAAARSDDARRQWEQLVAVRRQLNRLAVDPGPDGAKRLGELQQEEERLARGLTPLLPDLAKRGRSELGPEQLLLKLPADTAFIDFFRHGSITRGEWTHDRYQAFVLTRGRPVRRIDLGEAEPIESAIRSWRLDIDRRVSSQWPAKLKALVWDKLSSALPKEVRTVFLCPDGDLARLPWAALPGQRSNTVLLEELALVLAPSGNWLLEQWLDQPARVGADSLVAAGAIEYGAAPPATKTVYNSLPATEQELDRIVDAFGPGKSTILRRDRATPALLRELLPKARYAHFATHGYFDETAANAEAQRSKEQLQGWTLGRPNQGERIGAVQNPLGYVGLVLAGANDSKSAPDGGILTGLAIVDLPLEGLRLCVLSACETGLGELTAGEGIMGLQRAFHVAGCPNVVASLWKVNDAATAALMAKFYHELWVNKKPPIEALREAQLFIYYNPEKIPDVLGERGAPKRSEALAIKGANPQAAKRADTKLWAAFVLSGVGK